MRELIVDSFAGGGGASTGIRMALGRSPDLAIDHDPVALAMHAANHPDTRHLSSNIWKLDPDDIGGPIGLLWASPDCSHFSRARGRRPVGKHIRDLAWAVVRWAKRRRGGPRVIIVENVEEFADWGPVLESGVPCPERKGLHFRRFVRELRRLGYRVEWHELRACDYGAPTMRNRLFLIARRDGLPIIWPQPTHGPSREQPHRSAAEIIDWSLPCPSIFATSEQIFAQYGVRAIRPLADATIARIAKGVRRYVLDVAEPFIVPDCGEGKGGDLRAWTLINTRNGERKGQQPRCRDIRRPYATVTAEGSQGALVAFLAQHNTDMVGHDVRRPVSTIVQKGCTQAVVSVGLLNLKGADRRQSAPQEPSPTQTAGGWHIAEVRAFLLKYFGTEQDPRLKEPLHTCTTKDRFGLCTVTIGGEPYRIVDIGMRMLTPRELFRAQGFPDDYIIDRGADGHRISKTDQIRMCGNSVCPPVAAALVRANYAAVEVDRRSVPEFALIAAE